jgi:hypothetical protein
VPPREGVDRLGLGCETRWASRLRLLRAKCDGGAQGRRVPGPGPPYLSTDGNRPARGRFLPPGSVSNLGPRGDQAPRLKRLQVSRGSPAPGCQDLALTRCGWDARQSSVTPPAKGAPSYRAGDVKGLATSHCAARMRTPEAGQVLAQDGEAR